MSKDSIQCGVCGQPGTPAEMVQRTIDPEHDDQAPYTQTLHSSHLEENDEVEEGDSEENAPEEE